MRRILFVLVFVFLFAVGLTFGQSCRGSYLTYIVRDAKGKVISNTPGTGVEFTAVGTSPAAKKWRFGIDGEFKNPDIKLPADLAKVASDTKGITTSQFCNFRDPLTINITLKGKTMELTFNPPRMNEQESADLVVDSLPFKAGKYAITLAKPTGFGAYYAASGWKKIA